jgi:hypothetical protein
MYDGIYRPAAGKNIKNFPKKSFANQARPKVVKKKKHLSSTT